MALAALIVSRDAEAVRILTEILNTRGIEAEVCDDKKVAQDLLEEKRYSIAILDCDDERDALSLVISARAASVNSATLTVASVDAGSETRELFDRGINFVMYKPISAERASESLQAAWGLLPREKRRKQRSHVSAQASITFATTEDTPVPLLNVSEDGIAIQSLKKISPPTRVYFQFTLPGQPAAVRLAAEVIWQDWKGEVGLHFAHVPQTSRRMLDEWLKKNPNRRAEKNSAGIGKIERFVLPSPEPGVRVPKPAAVSSKNERRAQARRACRLGVNVYRPEGSVLHHCTLTDVSKGGGYIETTAPLSVGTQLTIEVRTEEWKLRVQGKVQSAHVGFGMGVEFRSKAPEDKEQVRQLLVCIDAQVKRMAEPEIQID
jgi:CheY-like chemotaxis protein